MSRVTKKLRNLTDPEKLMIYPIIMIIFLSIMAVSMLANENVVANETSLANDETVEAFTEAMTTEEPTEITEEESEVIETTEEVETSMKETTVEETEGYVEPTTVQYFTVAYPYTEANTTSVTVSEVIAGDDNPIPVEETAAASTESFAPFYYINCEGITYTMSHDLQTYIYNMCVKYDMEWFYPYFMAQLFHESRWQEGLVTERGDYGIAQINISMHPHLTEALGITDFANSYNSVTAGLYLMHSYISRGYTVRQAMTAYRWGEGRANDPDPENYYDTVCGYTQCLFREN